VALVLDNGSTHAPKQLPGFTQELETTSEGKLIMQLYWLPTNASWLDQIEIWCDWAATQTLAAQSFPQPR